MTTAAALRSMEAVAHSTMTGIWEFAHPQAIAWGVGLAVLIAAISVEGLALWSATHQQQ